MACLATPYLGGTLPRRRLIPATPCQGDALLWRRLVLATPCLIILLTSFVCPLRMVSPRVDLGPDIDFDFGQRPGAGRYNI